MAADGWMLAPPPVSLVLEAAALSDRPVATTLGQQMSPHCGRSPCSAWPRLSSCHICHGAAGASHAESSRNLEGCFPHCCLSKAMVLPGSLRLFSLVPTDIKWQHCAQPRFPRRGSRRTGRPPSRILFQRAHLPWDRAAEKRQLAPKRHCAVKLAMLRTQPCLQLLAWVQMPAQQDAPHIPQDSLTVTAGKGLCSPLFSLPFLICGGFCPASAQRVAQPCKDLSCCMKKRGYEWGSEWKAWKYSFRKGKLVFRFLLVLWKRKRIRYTDATENKIPGTCGGRKNIYLW